MRGSENVDTRGKTLDGAHPIPTRFNHKLAAGYTGHQNPSFT